MTAPELSADLYGAALLAAERNMGARYPKAELYGPGTGFPWSAFLPALADAGRVIAAQAAAAERERIIRIASQMRASVPADHPKGAQASFADYLRVTSDVRQDGAS